MRDRMADKKLSSLSPLEWKIMRIVCELKKCAARDVYQITKEKLDMHPVQPVLYCAVWLIKGISKLSRLGIVSFMSPKSR